MEEHPNVLSQGVARKSGEVTPLNAGDVVATVVDWCSSRHMPLARQWKGMIARQAKTLLEDGFSFEVVAMAAIFSIRRGAPQHMHFLAGELTAVRAGEWISTRDEWRRMLEDEDDIRRAVEKREEERS